MLPKDHSDDDVEIVDSGQILPTRNPNTDEYEFWAVVENTGDREAITIELELRNERGILESYERTIMIDPPNRDTYRFRVPVPEEFDQYLFNVIR